MLNSSRTVIAPSLPWYDPDEANKPAKQNDIQAEPDASQARLIFLYGPPAMSPGTSTVFPQPVLCRDPGVPRSRPPRIIAEIELAQVTVQALLANVVVNAVDPTLQSGERHNDFLTGDRGERSEAGCPCPSAACARFRTNLPRRAHSIPANWKSPFASVSNRQRPTAWRPVAAPKTVRHPVGWSAR